MTASRKKILASASPGGHWKQLLLLSPAFEGAETVFITAKDNPEISAIPGRYYLVPDASRHSPFRAIELACKSLWIMWCERPDVVISTGALPGLASIVAGRLLGARTLWIDSIANAQELSMCGRAARRLAHTTLSQWRQLSDGKSVFYIGSII